MANHEKHIDDLLRDALGDHTEQPPAGAWADMEARLDEGKTLIDVFFSAALSDHTETPPANAWADMEARLDAKTEFDHAFEEALGDYAEIPPAGAWADMEARLDKKPRRRRGMIWLWSAAAVAGLLWLGYFLVENNEQHSANRRTEVKTETPVATPVVNTAVPQPKVEEKVEAPVEQVAQTPKQQAPVTHKVIAPRQEAPQVAQQKETPVQKVEPQQLPAEPKDIAVQNDSAEKAKQVNVDDIASAIRRRAKGTVMNLKRSRYADSVAEAEKIAQQKADEEKAKQQEVPTSVVAPVQEPVVAAKIDSVKEIPNETAPDTMNALVQDAVNSTLKSMEVAQDAIQPSQIDVPVENALTEMGTLASKAAETVTNDPEKGTLVPFIGPVEDTKATAAALAATAGSTIEDADMIMRRPITFDWFVKTGYEAGLNKKTINKFVFAPSVQIGLSEKVSVILQPTIKSGRVNYSQVSDPRSFRAITHQDHDTLVRYTNATVQGITTTTATIGYYYLQTYDSLVVSNRLSSRSVIEAELPVLLSYDLGRNFSLYGGPMLTYSNTLKIEEDIRNYGSFTRKDSVKYEGQKVGGNLKHPDAPAMGQVLQYNTPEITEYNRAPYQLHNANGNKFRVGYMLGASYNYKRMSADITVQQNLSRINYIANPGVRSLYLQPYMRFMLGFKLNK